MEKGIDIDIEGGIEAGIHIRPCEGSDVVQLDQRFPHMGMGKHLDRHYEQQRGEITYLIAWRGGQPVGHIKVVWAGSVHAHVRRHHPDVPELRRLFVHPEVRGHGVGTHLLQQAEALAAERGYEAVGLAVGVHNMNARRLYERLGYADWQREPFDSRWVTRDHGGDVTHHQHVVTYLTKSLRALVLT